MKMKMSIDMAFEAQQRGEKEARAKASETMPTPPLGYPALKSVSGAMVLGYEIGGSTQTHDVINPSGRKINPGDAGYMEAQRGRLKASPMPQGYKIVYRTTTFLYALVSGNPILLEEDARAAGYVRATATSPIYLKLTELL